MEQTGRPARGTKKSACCPKLKPCTGIKCRLEFADPQWWTVEWLKHIDKIAGPKQKTAAKNYVRSGHVIEMNVSPGLIDAKVQGRRSAPYHVRLYSPMPTDDQMSVIMRRLSERAIYGAQLLSGEMPRAVREIYASSGAALLPDDFEKCRRMCSCPEQIEDCKHILAVLFVSADVFDRDPFLLLKMRGLEKDALLSSLTSPRGSALPAGEPRVCDAPDIDAPPRPTEPAPCETPPLSTDASFYGAEGLHEELSGIRNDANEAGDVPGDRSSLFDFPLWRGEASFKESIYPYYECVKKFLKAGP
ncbi:MAG: hypothetical protein LBQ56_02375 [Synergistaceae bacterium]|jgi:uncharacterized Zn finger protein|nr:hypothetical protein [Synergistaceae bacterium]